MTRTRAGIVAVLTASLLASMGARQVAMHARHAPTQEVTSVASGAPSGPSVGSFDSYALALLLGGLRGPLVMVLWPNSESQKSERNLEDFDTKVEWIRLLQPEFDSVHIFQIWNKAYNISVLMASPANKYATVLDALSYAEKVDADRPDNINILVATAQVWFDKLGSSNEKAYYRARVRRDTLPHAVKTPQGANALNRRTSLDPYLDDKGNILPEKAAVLAPIQEFGPFPQGLSPLAIGYSYYKRAQTLQNVGKQRHLQLSDMVIDSRPALSLKTWSEEEWERGRRYELDAYGLKGSLERMDLERLTAGTGPSTPIKDPKAIDDAIYAYSQAATLGKASLAAYEAHIANYKQQTGMYRSHQDHVKGTIASCEADRDYFKSLKLPAGSPERKQLEASAIQSYRMAREIFALNALRYYTADDVGAVVYPVGKTKFTIDIDPAHLGDLTARAIRADQMSVTKGNGFDEYGDDRGEYINYMSHITSRLAAMGASE